MKKLLAWTLISAMAMGMLAGCGNDDKAESAGKEETAVAAEAGTSAEAVSDLDFGGAELKVLMIKDGSREGWADIEEKINEITTEKLNLTVSVDWIEFGNWNQQLGLRMASGDEMDIIQLTPLMTFTSLQALNQLADITDALDEYGQDILAINSDYLKSTTVDGRIYGVPNYFAKGSSAFLEMRTSTLEELGLMEKAQNMKTWDDFEAILTEVEEKTDLTPLYTIGQSYYGTTIPYRLDVSDNDFSKASALENLGDSFGLINIDPETDTVYSYYLTDVFKEDCARAADYYKKGLLFKDGENSMEAAQTYFKDGTIFSVINLTETLMAEESMEAQAGGTDLTMFTLCDVPITRATASMWGYAVPYTSAEVDAAVAFLNLMYTDADLMNYFTWGIEDRDYTVNANGSAQRTASTLHESEAFFYPNNTITHSSRTTVDNYSELVEEALSTQVYSKYLTFDCDTEPVDNAMTACYNAKMEFVPGLICGGSDDWEGKLEAFQKKLRDNGIEDVIAYYQEQVDAWLAAQ